MVYVVLDEMYDYMPCNRQIADAEVPDELGEKLQDAIAMYRNASQAIRRYISEHPESQCEGPGIDEVLNG